MTPATSVIASATRTTRTAQSLRPATSLAARDFLRAYLPKLGMPRYVGVASMIVHFTGYELDIDDIELDDPRDILCGHLIGTADMIAQMADRCYLEKCRDHLYREFVLGGVAIETAKPGQYKVRYTSGEDLLQKTPFFYQEVVNERLKKKIQSCLSLHGSHF